MMKKKALQLLLIFLVATASSQSVRAQPVLTSITFVLSNEAPGYLIDHLIAAEEHEFGRLTLFQILVYFKAESYGLITDTFFNKVSLCPITGPLFTQTLGDYIGTLYSISIADDCSVLMMTVQGKSYHDQEGYETDLHEDILFTHYYDSSYPIFVGASGFMNYYAIAIAWRWEAKEFIPMMAK